VGLINRKNKEVVYEDGLQTTLAFERSSILFPYFNFSYNKIQVYTEINHKNYFKVSQAFKNAGLHYIAKSNSSNNFALGQHENINNFKALVIYVLYVNKDDKYLAQQIISTIRN